jgi:predicted nucleic acid-binding protein
MRKPRLYLETSVWNFLFADDITDKKEATERLFKEIEEGKYEIFISEVVYAEVEAAPEHIQSILKAAIEKYNPSVLEETDDVIYLAEKYIENGILSEKHTDDLLHLAFASFYGMTALISWNMRHLVKMRTQDFANSVNTMMGWRNIQIRTPLEVIEDEEQ